MLLINHHHVVVSQVPSSSYVPRSRATCAAWPDGRPNESYIHNNKERSIDYLPAEH